MPVELTLDSGEAELLADRAAHVDCARRHAALVAERLGLSDVPGPQ